MSDVEERHLLPRHFSQVALTHARSSPQPEPETFSNPFSLPNAHHNMSVTSDELNYLIWRYLQESGHELSTFALQRETRAHLLDAQFSKHISLGALVSIVQKGIQYMEVEASVRENGDIAVDEKPFTLFGALHLDNQEPEDEVPDNPKEKTNGINGKIHKKEKKRKSKDDGTEPPINASKSDREDDDSMEIDQSENDGESETKQLRHRPSSNAQDAKVQVTSLAMPKQLHDLSSIYMTGSSEAAQWSPASSTTLVIAQQDASATLYVFPSFYSDSNPDTSSAIEPSHSIRLVHSALDYGHGDKDVTAVAWNSIGTLFATASFDGQMRIWTAEGKLRHVLLLHRAPVLVIKWNEPNTMLLSVDCTNTVVVWDAYSGEVRQTFQHSSVAGAAAAAMAASSSASSPVAPSSYHHYPGLPPPGPYGSSNSTDKYLDDIPKGVSHASPPQLSPTLMSQTIPVQPSQQTQQALIVTGTMSVGTDACWIDPLTYATTGDNSTIMVYKISERGPLMKFRGHTQGVNCLQFDSRTQLLASASDDHSVKIWHGKSNVAVATLTGHLAAVVSIKWLPPTGILSALDPAAFGGSFNGASSSPSAPGFTPSALVPLPPTAPGSTSTSGPITTGTFGGQAGPVFGGARLASASLDGTIRIWDPSRSLCLAVLSLHESPIFACEASPNGRLLASGGLDGVLVIWDVSGITDVERSAIVASKDPHRKLNDISGAIHAIARYELGNQSKKDKDSKSNSDSQNVKTPEDKNEEERKSKSGDNDIQNDDTIKKEPGDASSTPKTVDTKDQEPKTGITTTATETVQSDSKANSNKRKLEDPKSDEIKTKKLAIEPKKKEDHINSISWSCDSAKICVCYSENSVIIDASSLVPNIH